MKRIRTIYRRIVQGQTEPVLAEAEDGTLYVVKSSRSTVDALVCEAIAAMLGERLGLPVPEWDYVEVRASEADSFPFEEARYLSRVPGFASRFVEGAVQLDPMHARSIGLTLRAEVLLFDFVIRNRDRSDDNANLLVEAGTGRLWVIDHNLSLGGVVDDLFETHVFREAQAHWTGEFLESRLQTLRAFTRDVGALWARLPEAWTQSPSLTLSATCVESLLASGIRMLEARAR